MSIQTATPNIGIWQFLESCRQLLSAENVDGTLVSIDRYSRSCSGESVRSLAIVRPCSVNEVQQVVKLASKHRIALYPISGGCNWGLGDSCPTTDRQVIVDLKRMNTIETVDAELGAFAVEPGVTQQQMFDYLESNQLPFWYDASGAGPTASLLGNLMERGYGHTPLGERFQNTCNYHAVLADGSLVKTGFGSDEGCAVKDLFKPGIGPSLDGIFTQSNYGIVTRATFWMTRIPEHFEAYVFQCDSDSQLEQAISALQPLRAAGVLSSALHIGNDYRVLSGRMQFPYDQIDGKETVPEELRRSLCRIVGAKAWNGLGAYYGTRHGVAGFRADLTSALRGITRPIFLTDGKMRLAKNLLRPCARLPVCQRLLSKLESAEKVMDLLKGKPVADHLAGAAWRSRKTWLASEPTPVERGDGLYWHTPVIPCKAADVQRLNSLVHQAFRAHCLEPMITYVMINSRAMVCPITIAFDAKDPSQIDRARRCWHDLGTECEVLGYPSYRISSFSGTQPSAISQLLKRSVDPTSILAPGRYGLGDISTVPRIE
jgi:4-cresol dehydrogenase (hydroxylating) flavoprotein subunit